MTHKNKNAILFYQESINDNLQFIFGYNKLCVSIDRQYAKKNTNNKG